MKKIIILIVICFLMSYANTAFAQWLTTGNVINTGEFLGSTSGDFPLELKTLPNQPMQFWTHDTLRMYINNTSGWRSGFVGIGKGFTAPQSLLHLNQWDSSSVFSQWTNSINLKDTFAFIEVCSS